MRFFREMRVRQGYQLAAAGKVDGTCAPVKRLRMDGKHLYSGDRMAQHAWKLCIIAATLVAGLAAANAPKPVTITLADKDKEIAVLIGQEVIVSLEGTEARTGWERSGDESRSLKPVDAKGNVLNAPTLEFVAKEGAAAKEIGTYRFRYKAVALGKSKLEYVYVSPGGPEPIRRSATKLVGRMNVTINVVDAQ
jgi:hypothetical protein